MLSFYKKIFIISYESVFVYEKAINNINLWDEKVRDYNKRINLEILDFLKKQKKRNQSIIHGAINYYINFHINSRNYFNCSQSSWLKFMFWSYINFLRSYSIQLLEYFKNQIIIYDYKEENSNIVITFGFPEHSFNYLDNIVYPNSFIEYLLTNKIINNEMNIISLNEYIRKSKEGKVIKNSDIKDYSRIIPKKKISIFRILKLPIILIVDLKKFLTKYQFFDIGVLIYYLSQKSKLKPLENLIKKVGLKNINKIFLIDNHAINHGLFDEKLSEKIYTFCYSQNCLDVHSNMLKEINLGIYKNNFDDEIFSDLDHNIFTYYRNNPINFDRQAYFFYNIRDFINKKFKLSIANKKIKSISLNSNYSNLGFETIQKISLSKDYSILMLDNTSENLNENFKHFILGNYNGLESFIKEFNDDILSLSKKIKIKFYYKAKYGKNIRSLNNLINSMKSHNSNISIIDSYSKIIVDEEKKFDLMINLPYTSTNYTLSSISRNSIYYIPSKYRININNPLNNLIIGKKELNKFIKKSI